MLNNPLKEEIQKIMSRAVLQAYTLDLEVRSETDTDFLFKPLEIETLVIGQNFTRDYTDNIVVQFNIALSEYADLIDRSQGLIGFLRLIPIMESGMIDIQYPQIIKEYRVLIIDSEDPRRQFPDVQKRETLDKKIMLRLIEKTAYYLRRVAYNDILSVTSIDDALNYIVSCFKIEKKAIVPSDNTKYKAKQMVISPPQKFDSIWTFMQKKFGVYMKGLNFYYTDKTLYIYPPYEEAPAVDYKANIYLSQVGSYAGASSFHRYEDTNTISVVINSPIQARDRSYMATENTGTAQMFLRSSDLVDGYLNINKDDITIKDDVALAVRLNNPYSNVENTQHAVYRKATDNPFALASDIIADQFMTIEMIWGQAVPFVFKPGHHIRFIYDNNGVLGYTTGILESFELAMTKINRANGHNLYSTNAKLKVRVNPKSSLTQT